MTGFFRQALFCFEGASGSVKNGVVSLQAVILIVYESKK
jgi:hypothetical protein